MSDPNVKLPTEFQAGSHSFVLELNYGLARKLRQKEQVDLINFHDGKAIATFTSNPDKLFTTLWLLCQAQCEEKGISEQQFADLFDAAVFESSFSALERAIVNFTPPAMRPVMLKICQKSQDLRIEQAKLISKKLDSPRAQALLRAKMEKVDTNMDQEIDQQIEKLTSGN